jgi:hypothetical protein
VKYAPILVPIILLLGIAAVKFYKPDGAVRINALQPRPAFVSTDQPSG